jgi:hypothetical protein
LKQVALRKENDTEFGMTEKKVDKPTEEEARGTESPAAS